MTVQQILSLVLIGTMMAAFVWGRLRYDLVALLTLFAAVAVGLVPFDKAFSGFSDDIVIIVAGALITSSAVAKSGLAEKLVRVAGAYLATPGRQIAALSGLTMALSAFVKNIGAMSMLMPPAYRLAARSGTPLSRLLMPMSFASLLGGLVTLVGTSPNIIVSRIRQDITGEGFRMFDFAPVGLPLALAGLVFLVLAYRLLPVRQTAGGADAALATQGYTVEAIVLESSEIAGQTVQALLDKGDGSVGITALIRGVNKRFRNPQTQIMRPGDRLLLEGLPAKIDELVRAAKLGLPYAGDKNEPVDPANEIGLIETVVMRGSLLIGWSPQKMRLSDRFNISVVGVSRRGEQVKERLKNFRFAAGDVVVLRGNIATMPDTLAELDLLPLAARGIEIGASRSIWLPAAILGVAMVLMALKIVTVPVAFFGAAVVMIAARSLTLREAYEALEPSVLVTLAALIPVSDTLRSTGMTDHIAVGLSAAAQALPAMGALALIMLVAMAVTPFLNNAATVLVAGPIAAGFARNLGYNPDPFLMAVAIGAACDFLTPIGHQCNMLVMGPGGYRFGDYWRLGLPLSILVVVLGVPLITFFWPL